MPPRPFNVVIPIYEQVDLLDVAAPREVFRWMRDEVKATLDVHSFLVARSRRSVRTRDCTRIVPDLTFRHAPAPDLLWVPGGDPSALKVLMKDRAFLGWLQTWSRGATYVTSVCEGAMLLDAAGLLDGHSATTHWAFIECLKQNRAITVIGDAAWYPRFVVDPETPRPGQKGIRVTGGGVSSGLDEALQLVQMIAGTAVAEKVQTLIQYFPDPPVRAALPQPACSL